MYHVYRNQAAAAYSSFYFFIFLYLQFSNIKYFVTLFSRTVRPRWLKLSTLMDKGEVYRVYQNRAAAVCLSLNFFIFLSLQFSNINIFGTLFSGTVRPRRLKLGWWADVWCIPESGCCCLFVFYFFIFLSVQFSNIRIFRHTFLTNCDRDPRNALWQGGPPLCPKLPPSGPKMPFWAPS